MISFGICLRICSTYEITPRVTIGVSTQKRTHLIELELCKAGDVLAIVVMMDNYWTEHTRRLRCYVAHCCNKAM